MKETNKKIMSLVLSGALLTSIAPNVKAVNYEDPVYGISEESMYSKVYKVNGIYTTMVNGKPVYVYLSNNTQNEYLNKFDALYVGELNYDNVYVFSKTVQNPRYVAGISSLSEKDITIYALSGKSSVNGWKRINKNDLGTNDKIATSIELGEFLLKNIDLSIYKYNMLGFANVDINKDGKSEELLYLGNNKVNRIMTKEEAIKFAISNYDNYYIQRKVVPNPKYVAGVTKTVARNIDIYAISDKSYVNGWSRINKSQLPKNVMLGSNTEIMEAVVTINSNATKEEIINIPNTPDVPGYDYQYMKKTDALEFAYSNYPDFCILSKTLVNSKTNQTVVIYSFSSTPFVEGWEIIGNDLIPETAYIFLSMEDANIYEYHFNNNYSKTLK